MSLFSILFSVIPEGCIIQQDKRTSGNERLPDQASSRWLVGLMSMLSAIRELEFSHGIAMSACRTP